MSLRNLTPPSPKSVFWSVAAALPALFTITWFQATDKEAFFHGFVPGDRTMAAPPPDDTLGEPQGKQQTTFLQEHPELLEQVLTETDTRCHALLARSDVNWTHVSQSLLSEVTSLSLGQPVQREFDEAACHFYRIKTTESAFFSITTSLPDDRPAADTQLYLLDADYRLLALDDDGGFLFFSSIDQWLTEDTYFILVASFDSRRSGFYRLLAQERPLVGLPSVFSRLDLSTPVRARVAAKADLWFAFTVHDEGRYSTETYGGPLSPETDTVVEIYENAQQGLLLLGRNDDATPDTLYSTVAARLTPGDYYARVSNIGERAGDFELQILLDPVPADTIGGNSANGSG